MQTEVAFFVSLLLPALVEQNSVILKRSDLEKYNSKPISSSENLDVNHKNVSNIELIIDLRNLSQSQNPQDEENKQRKDRIRKQKDKREKHFRSKNKSQISSYNSIGNMLRNNKKAILVRNKTMETLKSGLKILSAGEIYNQNDNKSNFRRSESLLEKILSSAVSDQDDLLSATDVYEFPVGFEIYKTKTSLLPNHTHVPLSEGNFTGRQKKVPPKKHQKSFSKNYDLELVSGFNFGTLNGSLKIYNSFDYKTLNAGKSLGVLLRQIVHELENLANHSRESCKNKNKSHTEDPCQKWLDCRKILDRAFMGDNDILPSCPCLYPTSIFYDEMIWDENEKKYFRWRDASNEGERLDIYKPGAAYCIRSLITQGSLSLSSQQCCYDRTLKLLTRGSGAGTMNLISPDISRKLHYTVDILPWKICKGDFTRYNTARYPNNGNNCSENPQEEQYQLQVKLSKIF